VVPYACVFCPFGSCSGRGSAIYLDGFSYSIFGEFYRPELIFEFGILLYFAFIISIFQRRIIYRPIGSEPVFTTTKRISRKSLPGREAGNRSGLPNGSA